MDKDCSSRDKRCAFAMRVKSLDVLRFSKHEHVVVDMKCTKCVSPYRCPHRRPNFQSTWGSKRRVHMLLWWKLILGIDFPITHDMMAKPIHRTFVSCSYGCHRNGRCKRPLFKKGTRPPKEYPKTVCINPHHYTTDSPLMIAEVITNRLDQLDINPEFRAEVKAANGHEDDYTRLNALCATVRKRYSTHTTFGQPCLGPTISEPLEFEAALNTPNLYFESELPLDYESVDLFSALGDVLNPGIYL